MYLKELGFSDEIIELLNRKLPDLVINSLNKEEKVVTANINYLKDLGVRNYVEAFVNFYNMFLIDNDSFDEIFICSSKIPGLLKWKIISRRQFISSIENVDTIGFPFLSISCSA